MGLSVGVLVEEPGVDVREEARGAEGVGGDGCGVGFDGDAALRWVDAAQAIGAREFEQRLFDGSR